MTHGWHLRLKLEQQSSSVITSRIGDSFLANLASRLDMLPSPTAPPLSLRPPYSLNLKVFHLFFSLTLFFYNGFSLLLLSVSLSLSFIWRLKVWKWNESNESLSLSLRRKTLSNWLILFLFFFFFFGEIA